jgi:hypothetical protein
MVECAEVNDMSWAGAVATTAHASNRNFWATNGSKASEKQQVPYLQRLQQQYMLFQSCSCGAAASVKFCAATAAVTAACPAGFFAVLQVCLCSTVPPAS